MKCLEETGSDMADVGNTCPVCGEGAMVGTEGGCVGANGVEDFLGDLEGVSLWGAGIQGRRNSAWWRVGG